MSPYDDRTAADFRKTLAKFAVNSLRVPVQDADDHAQDALLRLLRHRDRYASLPPDEILRIGQRTIFRLVSDDRKKKRVSVAEDDPAEEVAARCVSPCAALMDVDAWARFAEDAADLPKAATVLPVMRFVVMEGWEWREAMKRCGIRPGVFKHHVHAFRVAWRARHDPSSL